VARGASLGLYSGMILGAYLTTDSSTSQQSTASLVPQWNQGQVSGVEIQYLLTQF